MKDNDLDQWLTRAMRARPEHSPGINLARAALAKAQREQELLGAVQHWHTIGQRVGAVAALILAAILTYGGYSWSATESAHAGESGESGESIEAASNDWSFDAEEFATFGIGVLSLSASGLALATALRDEHETREVAAPDLAAHV